jgi:hypothetical protein
MGSAWLAAQRWKKHASFRSLVVWVATPSETYIAGKGIPRISRLSQDYVLRHMFYPISDNCELREIHFTLMSLFVVEGRRLHRVVCCAGGEHGEISCA